jgi:hypothetical protein
LTHTPTSFLTQRNPVFSSRTPFPVDANGNAAFNVACGSPPTVRTLPIIVTDVPFCP